MEESAPSLRVCCGPRCGSHPGHRTIYMTVERAFSGVVHPTLCQGLCGNGVTLILPDGTRQKILAAGEVKSMINTLLRTANNYGND